MKSVTFHINFGVLVFELWNDQSSCVLSGDSEVVFAVFESSATWLTNQNRGIRLSALPKEQQTCRLFLYLWRGILTTYVLGWEVGFATYLTPKPKVSESSNLRVDSLYL